MFLFCFVLVYSDNIRESDCNPGLLATPYPVTLGSYIHRVDGVPVSYDDCVRLMHSALVGQVMRLDLSMSSVLKPVSLLSHSGTKKVIEFLLTLLIVVFLCGSLTIYFP